MGAPEGLLLFLLRVLEGMERRGFGGGRGENGSFRRVAAEETTEGTGVGLVRGLRRLGLGLLVGAAAPFEGEGGVGGGRGDGLLLAEGVDAVDAVGGEAGGDVVPVGFVSVESVGGGSQREVHRGAKSGKAHWFRLLSIWLSSISSE